MSDAPERPRLVVFDIAGTTVKDSGDVVNRFLREALQRQGYDVSADLVNAVMGLPKPLALRTLLTPHAPDEEEREALTARAHEDFVERMRAFYETDSEVAPVDGAEEAFRKLRAAGVWVALDTGFSRSITKVILERFAWEGVIDTSICSDEVENGRPHPDMIFALMQRFGITNAAQVAKVGDTPSDLEEGTDAGCGFVIGVTEGTHTAEQLQKYPHTHLVPNVAHVPALFGLGTFTCP